MGEVKERVKAIALTDAARTEPKARENEGVRDFLRANAINWIASSQAVDQFEPKVTKSDGCCTSVSSGTPSHERSTSSALDSIFRFFDSRVPPSVPSPSPPSSSSSSSSS